jgi:hypothetical protein
MLCADHSGESRLVARLASSNRFVWKTQDGLRVHSLEDSLALLQAGASGGPAGQALLLAYSPDRWTIPARSLPELRQWLARFWVYMDEHARLDDFLRTAPAARVMPRELRGELERAGYRAPRMTVSGVRRVHVARANRVTARERWLRA